MPYRSLPLFAALGFWLLPGMAAAQSPLPFPLHYKWTPGQTLRYIVMRDPYFADPAAAIETADANAPYRSPTVERLTEQVLTVQADGTATLRLRLGPEPGFETDGQAAAVTQTVTVTAAGEIVAGASDLRTADLLAAIFRLPAASAPADGGLAILTQTGPLTVTQSTSPDHDGTLLQTTRVQRSDRAVYDRSSGTLLRRVSTLKGTLSLVMIRPPRRGVADFGRVVPNLPLFQTLTVERKNDLPTPFPPSRASTVRQSKN